MQQDFTRSMIDPHQDRQFRWVFEKVDKEELRLDGSYKNKPDGKKGLLDFREFSDFCFAIGFQFIVKDYKEEVIATIFDGDANGYTTYEAFKEFVDGMTKFEEPPETYEKEMAIFDEDNNGMAPIEDVLRVMDVKVGMSQTDRELFIKKCVFGPNLTDEQRSKPLNQLQGVPTHFSIKESMRNLYNL